MTTYRRRERLVATIEKIDSLTVHLRFYDNTTFTCEVATELMSEDLSKHLHSKLSFKVDTTRISSTGVLKELKILSFKELPAMEPMNTLRDDLVATLGEDFSIDVKQLLQDIK